MWGVPQSFVHQNPWGLLTHPKISLGTVPSPETKASWALVQLAHTKPAKPSPAPTTKTLRPWKILGPRLKVNEGDAWWLGDGGDACDGCEQFLFEKSCEGFKFKPPSDICI